VIKTENKAASWAAQFIDKMKSQVSGPKYTWLDGKNGGKQIENIYVMKGSA